MGVLTVIAVALCVASLPVRGRAGWSLWLGGMALVVGAWIHG